MTGGGGRRLLFVLSADYGELANALYFADGCGFDPALVMPDRLYSVNTQSLPYRSHQYRSADDILAASTASAFEPSKPTACSELPNRDTRAGWD